MSDFHRHHKDSSSHHPRNDNERRTVQKTNQHNQHNESHKRHHDLLQSKVDELEQNHMTAKSACVDLHERCNELESFRHDVSEDFNSFNRQYWDNLLKVYLRIESLEEANQEKKQPVITNLDNMLEEKLDQHINQLQKWGTESLGRLVIENAILKNKNEILEKRLQGVESEQNNLKRRLDTLEQQPVIVPTVQNNLSVSPMEPEPKRAKFTHIFESESAVPFATLVREAYKLPPSISWEQLRVFDNGRNILLRSKLDKEHLFLSKDKFVKTREGRCILPEHRQEFTESLKLYCPVATFANDSYSCL